jgi:uncharacterized membrane protein
MEEWLHLLTNYSVVIIETSIAPTWEDVGQLGAIAVIRTFLYYFLERDLTELGDRRPTR